MSKADVVREAMLLALQGEKEHDASHIKKIFDDLEVLEPHHLIGHARSLCEVAHTLPDPCAVYPRIIKDLRPLLNIEN